METLRNRRQHYRHEFAPTRKLVVRLTAAQTPEKKELRGELINLSVGGMCVFASGLETAAPSNWIVDLFLDNETTALSIAAERVYVRPGNHACCGFRFVSDAESEEFEKVVSRFLLGEQRRRRQIELGL